jgi:hypothetical protein
LPDSRLIPRSLRDRLQKYERALKLHRKGLTAREIGAELDASADIVGIWLRGGKPKRVRRYEPDLAPSGDLAYVSGFYLGDGRGAGGEPKVRFNLADKEQVEYVGGLVAKILGREPKPCEFDGLFYSVDYDSVVLSNFLNRPIKELAAHFEGFEQDLLRGFFDAEGYASPVMNHIAKRLDSIMVGAANTNLSYLKELGRLLGNFGLLWSIRRTNKKGGRMTIRGKTWIRKHDVFHLVITGFSSVSEFRRLIGFRIPIKAEKLADLIVLERKTPKGGYAWFTTHYRREGHRWVRIGK